MQYSSFHDSDPAALGPGANYNKPAARAGKSAGKVARDRDGALRRRVAVPAGSRGRAAPKGRVAVPAGAGGGLGRRRGRAGAGRRTGVAAVRRRAVASRRVAALLAARLRVAALAAESKYHKAPVRERPV